LSVHDNYEVFKEALEWIPYDRFNNAIKRGFSETYRANWIDGYIYEWDDKNQNWKRNSNTDVFLKILNSSENIDLEFKNEINISFGITQNPITKNYMMVLNNKKCNKCNNASISS
ncbi:hypothetical protein RhiirA1_486981, partial [Rhizophagus irregularis]